MEKTKSSGCRFDPDCERGTTGHLPAIGRERAAGCPFPVPVVDIGWDRGEYLFHQGDRVRGAYSLRSGMAVLERLNDAGELVVLKLLQPGAFFPCADLFADGIHSASARAMADVTACFIPADRLMALIGADARLGLAIAQRGCAEARENENIIFRLCSGDLAERVTGLLESLGREAVEPDPDGALTFSLPISWRDLAGMVGTSPEVMSRLLRRLSDAGRLSFSGRKVTLLPPSEDGRRAAG